MSAPLQEKALLDVEKIIAEIPATEIETSDENVKKYIQTNGGNHNMPLRMIAFEQ